MRRVGQRAFVGDFLFAAVKAVEKITSASIAQAGGFAAVKAVEKHEIRVTSVQLVFAAVKAVEKRRSQTHTLI